MAHRQLTDSSSSYRCSVRHRHFASRAQGPKETLCLTVHIPSDANGMSEHDLASLVPTFQSTAPNVGHNRFASFSIKD